MGRSSSGMYRVLPNNRTELIEAERPIGGLQLGEATYQPGYRTPAAVYLTRNGQEL